MTRRRRFLVWGPLLLAVVTLVLFDLQRTTPAFYTRVSRLPLDQRQMLRSRLERTLSSAWSVLENSGSCDFHLRQDEVNAWLLEQSPTLQPQVGFAEDKIACVFKKSGWISGTICTVWRIQSAKGQLRLDLVDARVGWIPISRKSIRKLLEQQITRVDSARLDNDQICRVNLSISEVDSVSVGSGFVQVRARR